MLIWLKKKELIFMYSFICNILEIIFVAHLLGPHTTHMLNYMPRDALETPSRTS